MVVLRMFAKQRGLEFDIEQLEIAQLTRRKEGKMMKNEFVELSEIDKEILRKKNYIANMIDYLKLDAFFTDEDMKVMIKNNDAAGKQLVENTQNVKKILEFIIKTQWNRRLDGNKKLARKILDTVKSFEKPELNKQKTYDDIESIISLGSNMKKREPSVNSIQLTQQANPPEQTIPRRQKQ